MASGVDEPRPLLTPLQCWHESLVSARTDPLVALSADGAFIATDRPVPTGTPLFLELSVDEEGARAEVDAVAVAGEGPEAGFAVRFLALDDDARRFIAEHLREEERARSPGATRIPSSIDAPSSLDADATSSVDLLPPPVAEPPAQRPSAPVLVPVAPIELSLDDSDAAPLSAADLTPTVPEAQAPARADAIELSDLGFDTAAFETMPAPLEAKAPALELPLASEEAFEPVGDLELEAPAMAAMPSPPSTPVPIAAPFASRASPAPVPETEQTIKWARAPAAAAQIPSSSAPRNPFGSGDSALSNPFAPREKTERFAPAPAAAAPAPPSPPTASPFVTPPSPARPFTADDRPERVEQTERWIRPSLPSTPTPASMREIEETRPWSRAALQSAVPRAPTPQPTATQAPQPPRLQTPPLGPAVPGAELPGPALPRAPMPRIASMDVPGSSAPPPIEQTQRWPTAKVRVADAPLEMPVSDVPFSQPPELFEQEGPGGGLDALFPADGSFDSSPEPAFSEPMLDPRLEVKPALDVQLDVVEAFEPPPAPAPAPAPAAAAPSAELLARFRTDDETLPLPAAPGVRDPFKLQGDTAPLPNLELQDASLEERAAFGPSGAMLGSEDDFGVGGNAADLFGGVEITDPGSDRRIPATAEDGFEAPDDIGPTLEASEPLELTADDEADPLEMVEVDDLEQYRGVLGAPPPSRAPAPSSSQPAPSSFAPAAADPQVAPMFDELEAEPMVTAEIPAETQERLLQAAMAKPAAAMPAPTSPATGPVRTDPLFSQPPPPQPSEPAAARPEPRPTETQPYFTLGALGRTLAPLPPPPAAMTRPPPLPPRAATPVAPPSPPVPTTPALTGPLPQRTDPFFPSVNVEPAARPIAAHDPFAGLSPMVPASAAAPLLGNAVAAPAPPSAAQAALDLGADSFFDEMAFEMAEQKQATLPTPADQWQVQSASGDDDIPVLVGSDDIPTVMGRSATPSTANPWMVGEPAKKS